MARRKNDLDMMTPFSRRRVFPIRLSFGTGNGRERFWKSRSFQDPSSRSFSSRVRKSVSQSMKVSKSTWQLFLWTTAAVSHHHRSQAFGLPKKRPSLSLGPLATRSSSSSGSSPFSSSYSRHHQCPAAVPSLVGNTLSPPFPWTLLRGGNGRSMTATTAEVTEETQAPVEIFRQDYRPLPFTVSTIELDLDIRPGKTTVTSHLTLADNPAVDSTDPAKQTLILDGDAASLHLLEIDVNGQALTLGEDYDLLADKLVLKRPQAGSVVTIRVEIVPENNTQLSGLYKSGSMYSTQCEAMGFRRITYYPDRPDNMAIFDRVRIEADATDYPVLLSNGNLIDQGVAGTDDQGRSRHYTVWQDPFRKPSYLFAVVAGNLQSIQDTFTTRSGRQVHLEIFSEPANVQKLHYAMDSLKRAMKWDEDRYGLEYDLDLFNIVAVESFNMGAMENKSLNIFNTAYVLADKKTATDVDFERVEGVIGHEYFHNWTGNRVTCRDWFQLTLKEGLTVFRDQEFSADMSSAAVKRIEDVRGLRGRQFSEDAGPMKHPIRPESYISMDNFYTATVYVKGAEVIRMYQTLLGRDGFRKGMDRYFELHDGQAVTCDDFLSAMAEANGVDLSQFARWYSTPGTPVVKYSSSYEDGTLTLTLSQSSASADPLHIPVAVGLLDKATGQEVVATKVLDLKEPRQTFTFDNLKGEVVPSILRDFSAPIKLQPEDGVVDEEALAFLATYDTDGFNRWEAGQKMFTSLIFQTMKGEQSPRTLDYVMEAFHRALTDKEAKDFSIQAYTMTLPSEMTLAEEMDVVDPIGIHEARGVVKKEIARKFKEEIQTRYDELTSVMEANNGEFSVDATSIGRRRLRNVYLEYLCSLRDTDEEEMAAAELAMKHFENSGGMTDKMAGLNALASMSGKGANLRDAAMQRFYDEAEGDALVLNKWFSVQAMANLPDVLDRVKELRKHPDFTLLNPNRCRSLIGAFAMNLAAFHAEDGAGYEFLTETLEELDKLNPQISSRLASSLIQWRRYDEARGAMMKAQLEKLSQQKLSKDLYEIVSRGLK